MFKIRFNPFLQNVSAKPHFLCTYLDCGEKFASLHQRNIHLREIHEPISRIFICPEKHDGNAGSFYSKAKFAEHLCSVHHVNGEKTDPLISAKKSPGKSTLIDDSSKKLEDIKTFQIMLRPSSGNQSNIRMIQINRSRPATGDLNCDDEEGAEHSRDRLQKRSKIFKPNLGSARRI